MLLTVDVIVETSFVVNIYVLIFLVLQILFYFSSCLSDPLYTPLKTVTIKPYPANVENMVSP